MTGNHTACVVAFVTVMTPLFCRVCAGNDVCSGSKYRFCVPQNRRHCLRALAGMANNLNQLAHLAHIHGPQHIADENRRLSREISGLIVELNKQL